MARQRGTSGGRPSYFIHVDAVSKRERIPRIPCKVFLDLSVGSRSRVILLPDKTTAERIFNGGPWSLFGETSSLPPRQRNYVHVPRFDPTSAPTTDWNGGLSETEVRGTSSGVIVVTSLPGARRSRARLVASLHGGAVVAPRGFREASFTGSRRFQRSWRCRARVALDSLVWFDRYWQFPRSHPGKTIEQLVLATDLRAPLSGPQITLRRYREPLEDLLALVSIAGRERTSWHHLSAQDGHILLEYFDTQRARPSARGHALGALIEKPRVAGFLESAFRVLRSASEREELISASYSLAPYRDLPLDSAYLGMFTALEALTQRLNGGRGGSVLEGQRWEMLNRNLRSFLKTWSDASGGLAREQRAMMYSKLQELNRESFGGAWRRMVSARQVALQDLWPVVASDGLPDLVTLRNGLAHGRPVPQAAGHSLARASLHLRWTLERVVLATLGFEVGGSTASPMGLMARGWNCPHDLLEERRAISRNW